MLMNSKDFWTASWERHLQSYFSAAPRTGIYLKHTFENKVHSIIEIACGSSRDSIYLSNAGYDVIASDFDKITLDKLARKNSDKNLIYQCADAFNLPFENDSFDLVFHNGFFICFDDDEKIVKLLLEQERISSNFIVFFVHNILNNKLSSNFKKLAKHDPLYDVRFFSSEEMIEIIKRSNIAVKKIEIKKFGGPADILNQKSIYRIIPNILYPLREKLIPKLYQYQRWEDTERIVCIIELLK
jgi:hypothetical protein